VIPSQYEVKTEEGIDEPGDISTVMSLMPTNRERLEVVVSTMALAVTLSGCPLVRERICSKSEHVVKSTEAPQTGRACVRDGEPPPQGYEEFPPGKVPTYPDEDR